MKKFLHSIFSVKALESYWLLLKLHQPVATFILLWPVMWSAWLAGHGYPDILILVIFFCSAFIVNTLACVVDDIAEKDRATKTAHKKRLLAINAVTLQTAWFIFFMLGASLILLMLFLNIKVILLGVIGLIVAAYYPFSKLLQKKRHIFIAFANAWIILMVFTANEEYVSSIGWIIALATFLWTLLFDNFYKRSDPKFIKKNKDLFLQTTILQALITACMLVVGVFSHMAPFYYTAIGLMLFVFFYQQKLIKTKETKKNFTAYNTNNSIGLIILLGIILNYFV